MELVSVEKLGLNVGLIAQMLGMLAAHDLCYTGLPRTRADIEKAFRGYGQTGIHSDDVLMHLSALEGEGLVQGIMADPSAYNPPQLGFIRPKGETVSVKEDDLKSYGMSMTDNGWRVERVYRITNSGARILCRYL